MIALKLKAVSPSLSLEFLLPDLMISLRFLVELLFEMVRVMLFLFPHYLSILSSGVSNLLLVLEDSISVGMFLSLSSEGFLLLLIHSSLSLHPFSLHFLLSSCSFLRLSVHDCLSPRPVLMSLSDLLISMMDMMMEGIFASPSIVLNARSNFLLAQGGG